MAEEKDTAAPAKRTTGKTGRRKKPEAEHAARAAPKDKDTGSKAQELLEQARIEPKPEWEVAEQVVLLPLDRLRPFKNHPFKVNDEDELMQDTIDSIMAGGVINPILVRPAEDGKFEVVSGHRRFRASELAGKADIKAIVRKMDDDTAVITMVDSNLQRENILPSERAFSYRMKMEALTHQGQRTDPTLRQVGAKFRTAELVGQPAGDSARQVQRFIRLTELIPQLLDMVDRKELAFNPAVELSYLKPQEQEQFLDAMDYAQATPSLSQAQRLKRLSQNGQCTLEAMYEIMDEEKKSELDRITIRGDVLANYDVFMEALRRSSPVPISVEVMGGGMDGYFDLEHQDIAIRKGMSEVQTVSAVIHEMAHALLHNRTKDTEEKTPEISRSTEEVQAESISYERFTVIETDEGYGIWDDLHDGLYVDEEGVTADFDSEWVAENYLLELKEKIAQREAAEWEYVEHSKYEAQSLETERDSASAGDALADTDKTSETESEPHFQDDNDLIGAELTLDGRRFAVDEVRDGRASLRDITFQNGTGFPIFRNEPVETVRGILFPEKTTVPQVNLEAELTEAELAIMRPQLDAARRKMSTGSC